MIQLLRETPFKGQFIIILIYALRSRLLCDVTKGYSPIATETEVHIADVYYADQSD